MAQVHPQMPITCPCEGAAEGGQIHILEGATEHDLLPRSDLGWTAVFQSAARGNHLDAVQWAYRSGIHVWTRPDQPRQLDQTLKWWYVLGFAAPHADHSFFKRIRAQGCMFDDMAVANAARHGRLDLLKWCYAQPGGCCYSSHLPVYELTAANGELLGPELHTQPAMMVSALVNPPVFSHRIACTMQ